MLALIIAVLVLAAIAAVLHHFYVVEDVEECGSPSQETDWEQEMALEPPPRWDGESRSEEERAYKERHEMGPSPLRRLPGGPLYCRGTHVWVMAKAAGVQVLRPFVLFPEADIKTYIDEAGTTQLRFCNCGDLFVEGPSGFFWGPC